SILLVDRQEDLAFVRERLASILRPVAANNTNPMQAYRQRMAEVSPYPVLQSDYPGVAFGSLLNVYVTNTEPSVLTQLRRCLQHYHALVRGFSVLPPT